MTIPNKTRFCVPTAVALIAGVDYDEAEAHFIDLLGEAPHGVYFPIALKILKEQYGYEARRVDRVQLKGKYIVSTEGHMFVVIDGKYKDNGYGGFNGPAQVIYEVWQSSQT